tara:strand:+ start:6506 stop:7168 length:663 start_codon:yes stop_codon:yes gene_type:complete
MAISIDDLKSGLYRGLAKPNLFEIEFPIPSALEGFTSMRELNLLCQSCTMPGKQVTTVDHPYKGFRQVEKFPTGYTFDDVTFEFLVTNDMFIKTLFDEWQNLIFNQDRAGGTRQAGEYRVKYKRENAFREDYVCDVSIYQLTSNDTQSDTRRIYGVKLLEAYPITLNALNFAQDSNNMTQKLSVTMTYRDFVSKNMVTDASSAINGPFQDATNPRNINIV